MDNETQACATCGRGCHVVIGFFLFLFGLNFLLGNIGVWNDYVTNIIWPALLILSGIVVAFRTK